MTSLSSKLEKIGLRPNSDWAIPLFLPVDPTFALGDLVVGQTTKLPLWQRDASLVMDRGHQGRQELVYL